MTGAALALAVAVLVAPAGPRWRARALLAAPRRLRMPGSVCAALVCVALLTLLSPTAVVAFSLLAATLLARRHIARGRRNRTATAVSLQGALDVLVGELRVGAHPVAAIRSAAQEADEQTARSLGAVASRALLGADVAAGLRAEGRRSMLPGHWERLAVCWHLAQAHGLAIAALMQAAQRDIAERERFCGRVEAGMAGARATATILAGLPVLGVVLGQAIGAEPLRFLLAGGAGGWLLVVGTGFVCCGLLWSDRITTRVADMTWAAVLLAGALLAMPSASMARGRHGLGPLAETRRSAGGDDALAVAASLDVLAACLRSGMAVSTAAAAVAESAPAGLAALLRRAADLLALGADAGHAWMSSVGAEDNHVQAFLRMARRSAASGTALAQGVEELAVQMRGNAADAASARAERASVLMAGPLGLCYLPAFLCLGIVPVVAGLAGEVLQSGVL